MNVLYKYQGVIQRGGGGWKISLSNPEYSLFLKVSHNCKQEERIFG